MLGSAQSRRLRTVVVAATLVGAVLATSAVANEVQPGRDAGHDPHKYTDPYAGFVAPPRATGPLAPATGSLLGTHSTDSASDPLDREHQWIMQTEETAGRPMDIDNSYYGGFSDIADDYDPTKPGKTGLNKLAFWDIENGRIPLVGWGCGKSTEIANSTKWDATIAKTAEAMKAFGHKFFMRYCWEMDGNKRTSEVGKPEVFVDAWIKIWTIFKQVGADNVIFVWCGNANTFKHPNDSTGGYAWDYYPGDQYVDWISADGYNWGASDRNDGLNKDRWRGFVEIFDEFMVWARSTGPIPQAMIDDMDLTETVFPRKTMSKPIMIGEYGVQEPEGSIRTELHSIAPYLDKETWLRESHDTVNGNKPRTAECPWCGIYSDIAAMVYFDIVGVNGPWIINSSEASKAAYREAGQDPWFNQISTIGWDPAKSRPDYKPPTTPVTPSEVPPPGPGAGEQPGTVGRSGYWMLGGDGKVYPFGDAKGHGDASKALESAPAGVVASDVEPSPTGGGYWLLDTTGKVHAFGDAAHFGDAEPGVLSAGEKVTSISASPTGKGYWLFTSKGRAITKGDTGNFGDVSKLALAAPVLDSIPTPTGKGYYMVAGDGGIFAFGDATFFGSMGDKKLNAPVESLVPAADGRGYWLVASDGGIFAFGSAPFRGSMGDRKLNKPVTGMVPFGDGYLMVAQDGGVFNFSDRAFAGSLGGVPLSKPIVAIAAID